jgi:hypothetical protein
MSRSHYSNPDQSTFQKQMECHEQTNKQNVINSHLQYKNTNIIQNRIALHATHTNTHTANRHTHYNTIYAQTNLKPRYISAQQR